MRMSGYANAAGAAPFRQTPRRQPAAGSSWQGPGHDDRGVLRRGGRGRGRGRGGLRRTSRGPKRAQPRRPSPGAPEDLDNSLSSYFGKDPGAARQSMDDALDAYRRGEKPATGAAGAKKEAPPTNSKAQQKPRKARPAPATREDLDDALAAYKAKAAGGAGGEEQAQPEEGHSDAEEEAGGE